MSTNNDRAEIKEWDVPLSQNVAPMSIDEYQRIKKALGIISMPEREKQPLSGDVLDHKVRQISAGKRASSLTDRREKGYIVYDSKGGDPNLNLNSQVRDTWWRKIVCRHLAGFVAEKHMKGYHEDLASPTAIKAQAYLRENKFDASGILNLSAYRNVFPPQVLGEQLQKIALLLQPQEECSLFFFSGNHAMQISIRHKQDGTYAVKFYDPNRTNVHRRALFKKCEAIAALTLTECLYSDEEISSRAAHLYFPMSNAGSLVSPILPTTSPVLLVHPNILLRDYRKLHLLMAFDMANKWRIFATFIMVSIILSLFLMPILPPLLFSTIAVRPLTLLLASFGVAWTLSLITAIGIMNPYISFKTKQILLLLSGLAILVIASRAALLTVPFLVTTAWMSSTTLLAATIALPVLLTLFLVVVLPNFYRVANAFGRIAKMERDFCVSQQKWLLKHSSGRRSLEEPLLTAETLQENVRNPYALHAFRPLDEMPNEEVQNDETENNVMEFAERQSSENTENKIPETTLHSAFSQSLCTQGNFRT